MKKLLLSLGSIVTVTTPVVTVVSCGNEQSLKYTLARFQGDVPSNYEFLGYIKANAPVERQNESNTLRDDTARIKVWGVINSGKSKRQMLEDILNDLKFNNYMNRFDGSNSTFTYEGHPIEWVSPVRTANYYENDSDIGSVYPSWLVGVELAN